LAVQARRGVQGSAETMRRWLPELGWVGKRAQLSATDAEPRRGEKLARSRSGFEPLPAKAARFLAEELDSSLVPTVGYQWRPKGEQGEGPTPGTTENRSLAGA
jgi:hypothetical protein